MKLLLINGIKYKGSQIGADSKVLPSKRKGKFSPDSSLTGYRVTLVVFNLPDGHE